MGDLPEWITAADLNHDDNLDLIVANFFGPPLTFLFGNGDGTFQPPDLTPGEGLNAVAAADLNGDGNVDLAVTDGGQQVSIMLGNGDGTFVPVPGETFVVGNFPIGVEVGDFNGDAKPDLLVSVSSPFNTSRGQVLLGNGDGTFFQIFDGSVSLVAGSGAFAAGELNNDGKLDVVGVAGAFAASGFIGSFTGKGDGTFNTIETITRGGGPVFPALADFNGDGNTDVAIANRQTNNATVLLGDGTGNLTHSQDYAVGTTPFHVFAADLNGDGTPELGFSVAEGLSVLPGNGDGTFATATFFPAGEFPIHSVSGDFDEDGQLDVATVNLDSDNVTIRLGQPCAGAVTHFEVTAPSSSSAGTAVPFVVTARDALNQTVTNYAGTVLFSSSDPQASLPGAFTFTAADAGSQSFVATLRTAGEHSITATDSGQSTVTGTSESISVASGPASRLALTMVSHVAAGATAPLLVQARDQFENVVTGYTGTVHFSSSDAGASLPPDYTFQTADAGSHSFAIILNTTGSQIVTATDTVVPGLNGSATGRVTGIQATATSLTASISPGAFLGFRQSITLTATVTPVTGPGGTVTFMDGTRVLGSVALAGNVGTLNLAGFTIGSHAITAIYDGDANFQFSTSAPFLLKASPKPSPRP